MHQSPNLPKSALPRALGGGLNRSMQHFILEGKDGVWMERRFHRGFTAAEKTELFARELSTPTVGGASDLFRAQYIARFTRAHAARLNGRELR
jgi:hypothetical protein